MEFDKTLLAHFVDVFATIPFNRTLGLKIHAIEADSISLIFTMRDDLIGNFMQNILHGGVIASVLDMAGGVAAMITAVHRLPLQDIEALSAQLGKSSTLNLHVDFLRPGKGQHFIAKATVLRAGSKITFTRMELFNQDEVLIATASGTYLIG